MFLPDLMRSLSYALVVVTLVLPLTARADDSEAMQFVARYPKGGITSVEMADRALAESEKVRAASEARYAADERACYDKFFATACMDKVKERRHDEAAAIRQVELEASAFKRRARVDEREQAMKEREAKRASEPPVADDRVQRHEEKMKTLQEQDAKQEEQRRKNVAAYEQKQRDVEQRQRDAERRQREAEQQKAESGQQNKGAH